jgi:hypothetical protein
MLETSHSPNRDDPDNGTVKEKAEAEMDRQQDVSQYGKQSKKQENV